MAVDALDRQLADRTPDNVFIFKLAVGDREVAFCILSGQPDAARGAGDGWAARAVNLTGRHPGDQTMRNDRDRWPTRAAAVGDCVAWLIQGLRDADARQGGS